MHDQIWTLLARRMANELLPEEEEELERLLQQHPDASYIKEVMMQPWNDRQKPFGPEEADQALERHKLRLESAMVAEEEPEAPSSGRKVRRMVFQLTGVAAALVFAFFIGRKWFAAPKPVAEEARLQLVTQKGSRSHIKLPDGTSVWLNAGSKLDYPKQFTGRKREVTLEGEAFFTVVKDENRPFMVRTKAFAVRVLGTEFNVRVYPQEDIAVASLVTGSVEVVLDEKQNRVVRLRPNEKLSISTLEQLVTTTTAKETVALRQPVKSRLTEVRDSVIAETAWVENKLAFKKMPLEKVVALMEQWYGADIRFKNENKKQLSFTAVFDKENLIDALKALELTGTFHFMQDADGVIWIE